MDIEAAKFAVVATVLITSPIWIFAGVVFIMGHDGCAMNDINKDLKIQYFSEVNNSMGGEEKTELIKSLCNETYGNGTFREKMWIQIMWSQEDIIKKCECKLMDID